MNLLQLIRSDIRAKAQWLYDSVTLQTVVKTLLTDGTFAMLLYRLMQAAQRCRLAPIAMVLNKFNVVFGQCIIGRGAEFGPALVLIHSQGIVINTAVRGGRNVFIEHQVTIGAEKQQAPVLGDDIFIGAGAKIIGAVRIGSRVKIGANTVVTKDVPDGATVVGIPGRVIKIDGRRISEEELK